MFTDLQKSVIPFLCVDVFFVPSPVFWTSARLRVTWALAGESAVSVLVDPRHADTPRCGVLVSDCHLPVRVLRGSRPMPYRWDQVAAPEITSNYVKGINVVPGVTAGPLRL